jgi:hypothetical protein
MFYIFYVVFLFLCIFSVIIYQSPSQIIEQDGITEKLVYGPMFVFNLTLFFYVCLLLWTNDWTSQPIFNAILFGFLFVSCIFSYFLRGLELFEKQTTVPCSSQKSCDQLLAAKNQYHYVLQTLFTVLVIIAITLAFTSFKK